MKKKKSQRTLALLAQLPQQVKRVVTIELANAKAEVGGRIKKLVFAIVLFILALTLLFWTTAVLLTAAIAGLSTVMPVWAAALIIGGAGLITLVLCVIFGISLAKRGNPVPSETIARCKADFAQAAKVGDGVAQMRSQPGKKGTKPGQTGVWE